MQLLILIGLEASGRTEYCLERLDHSHLRFQPSSIPTTYREGLIYRSILRAQQPIVIDAPNHTRQIRQRYIPMAVDAGYRCVAMFFDVDPAVAIARNYRRGPALRCTDESIYAMHAALEPPELDEGFHEIRELEWEDDRLVTVDWYDERGSSLYDPGHPGIDGNIGLPDVRPRSLVTRWPPPRTT